MFSLMFVNKVGLRLRDGDVSESWDGNKCTHLLVNISNAFMLCHKIKKATKLYASFYQWPLSSLQTM